MSHAILREALDTGGLWSVTRGLARSERAYKSHLAACDLPRRNDLDGRGSLSEEALSEFAGFFLQTCIDQVTFMESLRSEEHTSELQSLMRISYAVFCLKKKNTTINKKPHVTKHNKTSQRTSKTNR